MTVRDQLLDAAAQVYAEAGYRGATTRRIAAAAGVNEVTLFRQFGSKDALMREAIAQRRQGPVTPLPEQPEQPLREVTDFARAHLEQMRERRSLIRTCMGEFEEHPEIVAPVDSPVIGAAEELAEYLRRLRQRKIAMARFDETVAATMLMGVLFADAMGRDIMRGMFPRDPEHTLREYVRIFLRGLGVKV
jgi:AcrR family transcriptional regulator